MTAGRSSGRSILQLRRWRNELLARVFCDVAHATDDSVKQAANVATKPPLPIC